MAVNGAGRINFVAERGTKWTARVTSWTDEAGAAVAPNDYDAASLVIYGSDGTAAITLTHSSGITLGASTIDLALTPTQTTSLAVTGSVPATWTASVINFVAIGPLVVELEAPTYS